MVTAASTRAVACRRCTRELYLAAIVGESAAVEGGGSAFQPSGCERELRAGRAFREAVAVDNVVAGG